ncbi:hypothetical protein BZA05DRAFT_417040 [Tricharina praecox]|uniref:uncharacterized protein n=1 Tax=Tricharina praecox TaxID=43433 RepID=UPI002220ED16|nr:uncharacterized protein BZA05DRAFT_417040 [Tricharina praecox]KAI5855483.1 hypothetical protein BZA05DRAFT_417040 [Tricharina praecox]
MQLMNDGPRVRRYFFNPAARLNPLLRATGVEIRQFVPGKRNTSHIDPLAGSKLSRRRRVAPKDGRYSRYSLKEITTVFIHHCVENGGFSAVPLEAAEDRNQQVVKKSFTPEISEYLRENGCDETDVLVWAWILTAKDSRKAGLRLEALNKSAERAGVARPIIPPFLVLALLRREQLPRSTLHALFPIVEKLLTPCDGVHFRDHKSVILLAIRLLRQCRDSWPEALPRAVDLIVENFRRPGWAHEALPAWVTRAFNRLLVLLSLPTSIGPYRNVPLLQKCQFALIQKMATMEAPMTREGYRAIITVQVAHRKTAEESEKTRNMGKGWPPWFEERDGWVEAHRKAYEDVVSRGGLVIQQMMEAGYKLADWEKEAEVLTGKDTDKSPTIQTRSFWRRRILNIDESVDDSRRVWAARVRATRTLDEAWWNFQQCREQGVPHLTVWEEMFEKLLWDDKLQKETHREGLVRKEINERGHLTSYDFWLRGVTERKSRAVPGDGKELIHPPLNPRDGVYNGEPPLDVEGLFDQMIRDGIRPGIRLTTLLVGKVHRSSFAMTVLKHWDEELANQLIKPMYSLHNSTSQKPMNTKVLTAFLQQLSNARAIYPALRLVRHHRPKYRPAWNTVIAGFVNTLSPNIPPAFQIHDLRAQTTRTVWSLYKEMRLLVDIDSETLRLLAVAAERWSTLALGDEALWDGVPPPDRLIGIFNHELGLEISEDTTPMINPEQAALHVFVRALGFARRYDALEQVVHYLDRRELKLDNALGRRVLVAIKVFLEGAGYGTPEADWRVSQDGWDRIDRLEEVVNRRWGGWPGESECAVYLITAGLVRGWRVEPPPVEEEVPPSVEEETAMVDELARRSPAPKLTPPPLSNCDAGFFTSSSGSGALLSRL